MSGAPVLKAAVADAAAEETVALPPVNQQTIGLVATDSLRIAGLQAIFEEQAQVEVVPLSVAGALRTRALNLVIVDSTSTDYLFELLATFRRTRPGLKLLVIGESAGIDYIERVIGAGAKGFLSETATAEELNLALKVVQDGSIWAPRKVLARLLESRTATRPPAGAPSGPRLTLRESQVVKLLVSGKSNREIGERMGINAGTVKAHLGRIMRKTGSASRIELTMYLLNQHLVIEG